MKFTAIFVLELKHRMTRISTWLYFGFFLLMGYFAIFTALLGGGPLKNYLNAGVGSVNANAPYVLYYLISMMSHIGILITAAYFGSAAFRDFKENTHELYFSYPIKKTEYLAGRFSAAFVSNLFVFSGAGLGAITASFWPFLNTDKLGPVNIMAYVQPYLIGIIPNLIVTGALFFAIALLARKIFPVYLSSIGLFMGYIIGLSLLHSRSLLLASLCDPFGQIAVRSLYDYWTVAQKNTLLIPLTGHLLINRLVWISIGLAILTYAYKKFSFSHLTESKREKIKPPEQQISKKQEDVLQMVFFDVSVKRVFMFRSHIKQIMFTAFHDFQSLVKNIYFLSILFLGILFMFVFGFRNVGLIRGTQTYPATHQVLESLGNLFMFFLFVLIGFCAGELVWRERNRRIHEIYDTLPIPAWVPVLGKLGALFLVQILLMLVLMFSGLLIQALHGYFQFNFPVYLQELFGMRLITFLLMAVMALFIQIAVNNRLFGYFLFALFLILQDAVHMLGLEHHLWGYADIMPHTYSEMNGYGPFTARIFYFNLYYSAVAFLLIILSMIFWMRGYDTKLIDRLKTAQARMTKPKMIAGGAGTTALLLIGSFIIYNTNILNRYDSTRRVTQFQVDYEKKFRSYADAPLPQITDIKMEVDIYPDQKKVHSRGRMILENRTGVEIQDVFVQFSQDVKIHFVTFEHPFTLKEPYPDYGVYIYRLKKPMSPGERMALDYDQEITVRGFQNHAGGGILPWIRTRLLENGTFLYPFDTAPALCYDPYSYYELSDNDRRRKYGLALKERIPSRDDAKARMINPLGPDADWINFEAVVSTRQDQIALSAGELIKEWTEGDRRYFHYKAENKILKYFPFLSARYRVKKDQWEDVDIEIYYHPGHAYNIDLMIKSVKMSLDYYTKNFSPYPFKEIRIVEYPKYRIMAEGFPTILPFSEGYGFIAKFDATKVSYVFRATAHEVAHQWWAHQVIGANVEGVYFLMESMAQYSALMVTRQEYNQKIIDRYIKDRIDAYFRGRARETQAEAPMAASNREVTYVNYDKGMVVMNALQDYIGEDNLNSALQKYVEKVAFQEAPFTTTEEFLKDIEEATPSRFHYIITDWFETITLNDNRGIQASREKLSDGTYLVKFQFEARKFKADEKGKERAVELNDYIPFGVFDAQGKELYLQKHLITSGAGEMEFIVDGVPEKVGIDPHYILIDKNTEDNVIPIGK